MWRTRSFWALSAVFVVAMIAGRAAAADGCAAAATALDQLVCSEPALHALDGELAAAFADYLNRAAKPAEREARRNEERRWLDLRRRACPVPDKPLADAEADSGRDGAVECLTRIYAQRIAVLGHARNAAAWPQVRFRPAIVEGAGNKLCDELQRDLVAGFFGPAADVNPLGEREIGFVPIKALGDKPVVLRADIDAYNSGRPFPVLLWIDGGDGGAAPKGEYRRFVSAAELLRALGRGGDPLQEAVRRAAKPLIALARLGHADPGKPRAAFADSAVLNIDELPRFFAYDDHVYLLAPMRPAAGKPGDLGVYRLSGPAQVQRICLFEAHPPAARTPDRALALPEVAALRQAAAPLMPSGRLCRANGAAARELAQQAAWRPWLLDNKAPGGDRTALYLKNRALTGPEPARQYRVYNAARAVAIGALAPFYRREFGRSEVEGRRLAGLYLDRLIAAGFQLDPDDEAAAALLMPDYATNRALQRAALAGDMEAVKAALGPEPKAIAKGATGGLDEPLLADAVEHPQTLAVLLDLGLDPNEIGASGRTALMIAARMNLPKAAELLLAHGASPNLAAGDAVAQTDRGGDPLCMRGDSAAAADTPGRTALSYAAEFASPELVRLLLQHGADPGQPDSSGRRAADYVTRRSSETDRSAAVAAMLN
jgi:uncharacterized protein